MHLVSNKNRRSVLKGVSQNSLRKSQIYAFIFDYHIFVCLLHVNIRSQHIICVDFLSDMLYISIRFHLIFQQRTRCGTIHSFTGWTSPSSKMAGIFSMQSKSYLK